MHELNVCICYSFCSIHMYVCIYVFMWSHIRPLQIYVCMCVLFCTPIMWCTLFWNSKEQQQAVENSHPNISSHATPAKSSSSNTSAMVASLHKRKQMGMYVDQSSSPMVAVSGEKTVQKINIAAQQLKTLQAISSHTCIHTYIHTAHTYIHT